MARAPVHHRSRTDSQPRWSAPQIDQTIAAWIMRLGGAHTDDPHRAQQQANNLSASLAIFWVLWHPSLAGFWFASGSVAFRFGHIPIGTLAATLVLGTLHLWKWYRYRHGPQSLLFRYPWPLFLMLMFALAGALLSWGLPQAYLVTLRPLVIVDGLSLALPGAAGLCYGWRRSHRRDSPLRAEEATSGKRIPYSLLNLLVEVYLFAFSVTAVLALGTLGKCLNVGSRIHRHRTEGRWAFACPRDICGIRQENPRLVCRACHPVHQAQELPQRLWDLRTWPDIDRPLVALCANCGYPHPVWEPYAAAFRRGSLFADPNGCVRDCGLESLDGRPRLRIALLTRDADRVAPALLRIVYATFGTAPDASRRRSAFASSHRSVVAAASSGQALFVPGPGIGFEWSGVQDRKEYAVRLRVFDLSRDRQWLGGFDLALFLDARGDAERVDREIELALSQVERPAPDAARSNEVRPRSLPRRFLGTAPEEEGVRHRRGWNLRLGLLYPDSLPGGLANHGLVAINDDNTLRNLIREVMQ